MSNQLVELVNKYTVKYDSKIKQVCEPLKQHLNIPTFVYYTIDNDGRYTMLSSHPAQLEEYYEQKLYLNNPYLVHPSLLHSGCTSIYSTRNSHFTEQEIQSHSRYDIGNPFLIIQKREKIVEGFLFANDLKNPNPIDFISHIDLLKKFASYFIQEAQPLILKMQHDCFNIKEEKGQAFLTRDPEEILSNNNTKTKEFLNMICPLSTRERQCLELFQQGHSAQATGAILGISQRTVEHYFENIKEKLGVNSKWDLLAR